MYPFYVIENSPQCFYNTYNIIHLTGEATAPKDVTILGGKTGTTEVAGNCLAILTQNAYGKTFVSIVMGADTKELLYQEMNSLLQNINS